jgi:hypothetical protein
MSATAILRPAEITARALENRYFQHRALENRCLENRALESRFFRSRAADAGLSSRFFELADRLWLAEIDDAAALLELEDRLY